MLRVNFFSIDLQRVPDVSQALFGINDAIEQGDEGGMAYLVAADFADSNAIVSNTTGAPLTFEPLDHNIVLHPTKDTTYSLCDCMLYNQEQLCFIELKAKGKEWLTDAVNQLSSTIDLFQGNHDMGAYSRRTAYAANKRHPQFHFSQKELMQTFRNRYH